MSSETEIFRLSPRKGRFLLVVNKGPGAVQIPRQPGEWDVLEIYFKQSMIDEIRANPASCDADHVVFEFDRNRRKLAIVKKVFEANPFWQDYEGFMLADDDVEPVGCTISDIFHFFMQSGCRVGQPALTQDSYFNHFITVKNDNFVWRRTNMVEVMCPMFTLDGLKEYMPVFDASVSTWGVDFFWSYREWQRGTAVAMLDATPVRHGRAPGGGGAYLELETSPYQEMEEFMNKHGIPKYAFLCLGGVVERQDLNRHARLGLSISGYKLELMNSQHFSSYVAGEIHSCRIESGK